MSRVFAADVLRSAAVVFDVPLETLIGRRRDHAAARPRSLACRAIRTLCPHASYPQIARMLDRRDHTTIVKNVAKTGELLEREPALKAAYERLLRRHADPCVRALDAEITEAEARLADLVARRDALLRLDTLAPDPLAPDTLDRAGD